MSDTLVIDSVQITQWQSQRDFDYNRELVGDDMTFYEWLIQKIRELMGEIFGQMWNSTFGTMLLVLLALLVLGLIGLYLWRKHPGLFQRKDSMQNEDAEGEDTIYGVDFEADIRQAVSHEDWREAIRLCYLQALKALSDEGRIDWQPFKTPTQYVYEFEASSSLASVPDNLTVGAANPAAFRTLTAHFLRVRYGNFNATRELYDEVCRLRKEVNHGT